MKIVQVLGTKNKFEDDGQEIMLTVKQEKKGADLIFEGSKSMEKTLKENGIYYRKAGKMLFPKHRLEFMEALKYHYSGSMVRATDVMEINY